MECPDELCYKMLAEAHSVTRCNVLLLLARTRRNVLQVLVREIVAMLSICRFELDIESARRIRTLRHETLQRGICRRKELGFKLGFRFGYEDFPST